MEVQETDGDLERAEFAGRGANGVIFQPQIEAQAEILVAGEDCAEGAMEITVRLRGVPGDAEVLVGAVPSE
jgi:hypothetical protein